MKTLCWSLTYLGLRALMTFICVALTHRRHQLFFQGDAGEASNPSLLISTRIQKLSFLSIDPGPGKLAPAFHQGMPSLMAMAVKRPLCVRSFTFLGLLQYRLRPRIRFRWLQNLSKLRLIHITYATRGSIFWLQSVERFL